MTNTQSQFHFTQIPPIHTKYTPNPAIPAQSHQLHSKYRDNF